MGDLLELLATILLVGANAFFVAAEFSLISARRDRLEALAEQGRSSAVTALRAGEQLPLMFAGAQLGITVASLMSYRLSASHYRQAEINSQRAAELGLR